MIGAFLSMPPLLSEEQQSQQSTVKILKISQTSMRKDRPRVNLREECHTSVRHCGEEGDHPKMPAVPLLSWAEGREVPARVCLSTCATWDQCESVTVPRTLFIANKRTNHISLAVYLRLRLCSAGWCRIALQQKFQVQLFCLMTLHFLFSFFRSPSCINAVATHSGSFLDFLSKFWKVPQSTLTPTTRNR